MDAEKHLLAFTGAASSSKPVRKSTYLPLPIRFPRRFGILNRLPRFFKRLAQIACQRGWSPPGNMGLMGPEVVRKSHPFPNPSLVRAESADTLRE